MGIIHWPVRRVRETSFVPTLDPPFNTASNTPFNAPSEGM